MGKKTEASKSMLRISRALLRRLGDHAPEMAMTYTRAERIDKM